MRISSGLRTATIALAALVATSVSAFADSGSVSIRIVKAGFVIGGSGGSGVLVFLGRRYPLSIGGLSYGFTFGASETNFHGRVTNIRRPQDIEGVYGQAGAGAAIGRGAQGVVLTNQNGATLVLSGRQVGAIVSADLSGLALSLRR
jgi:lipid-binding SYLF domain-containing protein